MAQRKIQLVNDPQAKTSGPRNVECRICGTNVALAGEWDYTLASWETHKQTCPPCVFFSTAANGNRVDL
jgi:hypothetical protein